MVISLLLQRILLDWMWLIWVLSFYVNGKLSLLHASSKEKKVVVSKVALGQMLQNNDNWTGIRVLRMKK